MAALEFTVIKKLTVLSTVTLIGVASLTPRMPTLRRPIAMDTAMLPRVTATGMLQRAMVIATPRLTSMIMHHAGCIALASFTTAMPHDIGLRGDTAMRQSATATAIPTTVTNRR